jgi:hypothetical protein
VITLGAHAHKALGLEHLERVAYTK